MVNYITLRYTTGCRTHARSNIITLILPVINLTRLSIDHFIARIQPDIRLERAEEKRVMR
jgi:hypothetical protein